MRQEIEKKYLIREDGTEHATPALRSLYITVEGVRRDILANGKPIRQGYIDTEEGKQIARRLGISFDFEPTEVRVRSKGDDYFFTLKGKGGLERNEAELQITNQQFEELWPLTEGKRVEKVRLTVPYQGHNAEIDVYTDRDLIVAEVEVPTLEDAQKLVPLGLDVTEDPKYKNKNLAR